MSLSRRDFLKYGASVAGTAVATQGIDLAPVEAAATSLRIKEAKVYPGVCPYCAVGCAQLIYVKDNKIIDIEGDPDAPHTEGALCPKGSSTYQLSLNERRITKCLYRAAGSDKWEEKPLDWMMEQIAQRVKKTRDTTYVERAKGRDRQPLRGHRLAGLLRARQRRKLSDRETLARAGAGECREFGPALPLGHRPGAGGDLRPGRHDDEPDRRPARRRHHAHLELGRVPSRVLQVGDEGQGAGGQDHPRRSPLHPDLGHGRHLGADPLGHEHRVLRRPDPLRHREQEVLPRLRGGLHQRPPAGGPRASRPRRDLDGLFSGFDQQKRRLRSVDVEVPARRERLSQERPDAARSELRLPASAPSLLPLHAGDGRAGLRHFQGAVPQGRRHVLLGLGSGEDGHRLVRAPAQPVHQRRPADPRAVHAAAHPRQHRPPRRRRGGAARPLQRPGRHRLRDALPHAARLPGGAAPSRPSHVPGLSGKDHAQGRATGSTIPSSW